MHLPKLKVVLVVLMVTAVPAFIFLVPIEYIPYSYHTECTNFGANCQQVSQYSSLSYILFCTGGIYQTNGGYWIGTCMRSIEIPARG